MTQARTFLFDIGNVLVHFDFGPALHRLAERSAAEVDRLEALLAPLKIELESGRMGDADFITASIDLLGFTGTRGEFARIWGDIFSENPAMTRLVNRLAGRHRLLLFSNTSGLHKDWLFGQFPVFSRFEGGIYSYEAGSMKPEETIYREAIARLGLDPGETLYIDDLPGNIATGERLGFLAHHYAADQHAALEDRIERWLREGPS